MKKASEKDMEDIKKEILLEIFLHSFLLLYKNLKYF